MSQTLSQRAAPGRRDTEAMGRMNMNNVFESLAPYASLLGRVLIAAIINGMI